MKQGSIFKDVSPSGGGEVIVILSANTKLVWFLRAAGEIRSTDRPWFDHCYDRKTVVPLDPGENTLLSCETPWCTIKSC
jgi:hypothetical protein